MPNLFRKVTRKKKNYFSFILLLSLCKSEMFQVPTLFDVFDKIIHNSRKCIIKIVSTIEIPTLQPKHDLSIWYYLLYWRLCLWL